MAIHKVPIVCILLVDLEGGIALELTAGVVVASWSLPYTVSEKLVHKISRTTLMSPERI